MAITREQVLHVARLAQLGRSRRRADAVLRAAVRDPRVGREDRRARPRGRRAHLPSARHRQRVRRGRARAVADGRGSARERSRPRGRARSGCRRRDRHAPNHGPAGERPRRREASLRRRASRRVPQARTTTCSTPTSERRVAGAEGIPIALKDLVSTKGVETTAGSRILAGLRAGVRRDRRRAVPRAGLSVLGKTNMDEFAMGSSTENSAYGPTFNPWDLDKRAGRLLRRLGRGRRRRARSVGARLGHRRVDQAAGCPVRRRRAAADVRHRLALRDRRVRLEPRPDRADHEDGRDCALLYSVIAGRDPRDTTTVDLPAPVEIPEASDLCGAASRACRASSTASRASSRASRRPCRRPSSAPSSSARRSRSASCRSRSSTGSPATT